MNWMDITKAYKICPRCGSKFEQKTGHLQCNRCGLSFYMNPKPAVAVILVDNRGKFLFGERAHEPRAGYLDAFGGFVDKDENLEEAAVREMKEELGIKVKQKDLAYLGSFIGQYIYQGIESEVLNVVFTAKVPEGAVLKPADDMKSYNFYRISDIKGSQLAFTWIKKLLVTLDEKS